MPPTGRSFAIQRLRLLTRGAPDKTSWPDKRRAGRHMLACTTRRHRALLAHFAHTCLSLLLPQPVEGLRCVSRKAERWCRFLREFDRPLGASMRARLRARSTWWLRPKIQMGWLPPENDRRPQKTAPLAD